jgi:hypothetical protein
MEITCKVTEADFLAAWRLACGRGKLHQLACLISYWFLLFFFLFGLSAAVHANSTDGPDVGAGPNITSNPLGLALLAALWVFIVIGYYVSRRMRSLYRKNPAMQGQVTFDIAPHQLSVESTAGFSSRSEWHIVECWREGGGIIVLVYFSKAYHIVSLAGLAEAQRQELRAILTAALPKR